MALPLVVVGAAALGWLFYKNRKPPPPPGGDPGDPETWLRQLHLAQAQGDPLELTRLHLKLAELLRGDERNLHLLAAARIFEERLQDADAAISCYEEVLLYNPEESEALTSLAFLRGAEER